MLRQILRTMTAVLLIAWRRPDFTARVLKEIEYENPERLYVSIDGPRPHNPEESRLCDEVAELVANYSGDGQVLLRRMTENHGARGAILGAIDWFFASEDEGIILEDDSLPTPYFFKFCAELLEKYRSDSRVFQISGVNHIKSEIPTLASYYFSRHHHIWGFATWKRSWSLYQELRATPPDTSLALAQLLKDEGPRGSRIWAKRFFREVTGRDDNWDSGWNVAGKLARAVSATPTVPLVKNIGFDERALHAKAFPLISGEPPTPGELLFPLAAVTDDIVTIDSLDKYTSRVQWGDQLFLVRFFLAVLEIVRRKLRPPRSVSRTSARLPRGERTVAETFWGMFLRKRLRKELRKLEQNA